MKALSVVCVNVTCDGTMTGWMPTRGTKSSLKLSKFDIFWRLQLWQLQYNHKIADWRWDGIKLEKIQWTIFRLRLSIASFKIVWKNDGMLVCIAWSWSLVAKLDAFTAVQPFYCDAELSSFFCFRCDVNHPLNLNAACKSRSSAIKIIV